MKKIYILIIGITLLLLPNVYADDNQIVTFNIDQQNIIDVDGNLVGVELTFNLNGGDIVAMQHNIEYESDKIKLKTISANGSFTETHSDIQEKNNKGNTIIVIDGEYAYSEAPYLKLYFEFTDKFNTFSSTTIKTTENKAAGLGKKLINIFDKDINLNMNGINMLSVTTQDINKKHSISNWIKENKMIIYIVVIIIVIIIILDILYVSRKNRKQTIPFNTNAQFIDNNAKHLRNSLTDTLENENIENGIDRDKYKYKCIILLLLCVTLITANIVYATQGEKNQDIRNYIVGKKTNKNKSELDISGDGKIDVLDLVLEKCVTNYEIIRIKEWNENFLRNMNLFYLDKYNNKIPLEVYSVEYNKDKHFIINSIYNANEIQCEIGSIDNFDKKDNGNNWTYEFDYNISDGIDNCYLK